MKKRPCAICDDTNETTKICGACKLDPVNRDWRPQPKWEISASDVLACENINSLLKPNTEERAWEPRDLARAILTAWDSGKVDKIETKLRLDANGHRRGTYRRKIKVRSKRHLAQVLGCDEKLVRELIRREGSKRSVARVRAEQMAA